MGSLDDRRFLPPCPTGKLLAPCDLLWRERAFLLRLALAVHPLTHLGLVPLVIRDRSRLHDRTLRRVRLLVQLTPLIVGSLDDRRFLPPCPTGKPLAPCDLLWRERAFLLCIALAVRPLTHLGLVPLVILDRS